MRVGFGERTERRKEKVLGGQKLKEKEERVLLWLVIPEKERKENLLFELAKSLSRKKNRELAIRS